MKTYIQSDGNGGFVINKNFLAILVSLMLLFSAFVGAISGTVATKIKTEQNSQDIISLKAEVKEGQLKVAVLEANIGDIKGDLSEIKKDIKDLLKTSGGGQYG